jgi:hypothetical protein
MFCIHQILEKKWEYNGAVNQLFIYFKIVYSSVRREVLYNTLIDFVIPMKLAKLIKMCSNETCSEFQIGKHLSDTIFYSEWSETKRCFIAAAFQLCFRLPLGRFKPHRRDQN